MTDCKAIDLSAINGVAELSSEAAEKLSGGVIGRSRQAFISTRALKELQLPREKGSLTAGRNRAGGPIWRVEKVNVRHISSRKRTTKAGTSTEKTYTINGKRASGKTLYDLVEKSERDWRSRPGGWGTNAFRRHSREANALRFT